jgi:hypothetical protein
MPTGLQTTKVMSMAPTRDEWKRMVSTYGYHAAVRMLDCDLDDVPGIEETWLENFADMVDDLAKSEREFLHHIGVIPIPN